MQLLDGRKVSNDIIESLKIRVAALRSRGVVAKLAAFNVGEHKPSKVYLAQKAKRASDAGIGFELFNFETHADSGMLVNEIKKANQSDAAGIIFQLPMPQNLSEHQQEILNTINPAKDVDILTDKSRELLEKGEPPFTPPTAGAILKLLEAYGIDLLGHKILVIGQGKLVGRPLAMLLKNRGLAFDVADKDTKNTSELIRNASLIITATGQPGLITSDKVSDGVVVVDAGTAESQGKVVGDVDPAVAEKASFMTPVPGGVGPVTVAMLLSNVVEAAERLSQQ